MDIIETVRLRKSIRGYKPDPVPKEVIAEILEVAKRAPSAMNTQPWFITAVTGKVLDDIKRANMGLMDAGEAVRPDVTYNVHSGKYRERQVALAIDIFKLMGIAREDKEKRALWARRGGRFFDAPTALILSRERPPVGPKNACFDIGAIVQTICLVAVSYGLGTCIEDQGLFFPDVVRKLTGIPESHELVIGISIGYPDWDFPANALVSRREPLEGFVSWCGWE
ncbi:MAG: nitroreductase [Chloroflexi bacterium]|nr:nitroreductase [Chloroflexota bacterium]